MPLDLIGQGHCRVVRAATAKWRPSSFLDSAPDREVRDGEPPTWLSFPPKPAGTSVFKGSG